MLKSFAHLGSLVAASASILKHAREIDQELADLNRLMGRTFAHGELITVSGIAAHYGITDRLGDRFEQYSLQPVKKVRMLINHVPASLDGFWRVEQREDGLYVEGEVTAKVLRYLMVRKIDGLSVGFRTLSARNTRKCRFVGLAQLHEVSFVHFPAQDTRWRLKHA